MTVRIESETVTTSLAEGVLRIIVTIEHLPIEQQLKLQEDVTEYLTQKTKTTNEKDTE